MDRYHPALPPSKDGSKAYHQDESSMIYRLESQDTDENEYYTLSDTYQDNTYRKFEFSTNPYDHDDTHIYDNVTVPISTTEEPVYENMSRFRNISSGLQPLSKTQPVSHKEASNYSKHRYVSVSL